MRTILCLLVVIVGVTECLAQSRQEAEYYLAAYAEHYRVPLDFARALVQQESSWRVCAVSRKGAAGLMQLMPQTAARLGVSNACDLKQNVSGGIRYLAWLIEKFNGDLRLAAAAYYAGESIVAKRGLNYANPDVVRYVATLRRHVGQQPNPAIKLRKTQGDHRP